MKDLKLLPTGELEMLREELLHKLDDDLFNEKPELKDQFIEVSEIVCIRKIDQVMELEDIEELRTVKLKVEKAFFRIKPSFLSDKIHRKYDGLCLKIEMLGGGSDQHNWSSR